MILSVDYNYLYKETTLCISTSEWAEKVSIKRGLDMDRASIL